MRNFMNYRSSIKKVFFAAAFFMTMTGGLRAEYEGVPYTFCSPSGCVGNFFISVEALYLHAMEGNLTCPCDGAIIRDRTLDETTISTEFEHVKNPKFQWDAGSRVGIGYLFPCKKYGLEGYWTHFASKTKESHHSPYHWNLSMDIGDAIFSGHFCASDCLTLTPFGGVRYANIDQKLKVRSEFFIDESPVLNNRHVKQSFSALGPLVGLDVSRKICQTFGVYGRLSFAVLYGKFHVKTHSRETFVEGININRLKKHVQTYEPALDASFGLIWQICNAEHMQLFFQLGAELHRYFNQNQFSKYGDLCLDGVNAGIGFQF